jgi:hypothetical protein
MIYAYVLWDAIKGDGSTLLDMTEDKRNTVCSKKF